MKVKWDVYAIDGANGITYIGLNTSYNEDSKNKSSFRLLESIARDTRKLLKKDKYAENAMKEYMSAIEERKEINNNPRNIWPVSVMHIGKTEKD